MRLDNERIFGHPSQLEKKTLDFQRFLLRTDTAYSYLTLGTNTVLFYQIKIVSTPRLKITGTLLKE